MLKILRNSLIMCDNIIFNKITPFYYFSMKKYTLNNRSGNKYYT